MLTNKAGKIKSRLVAMVQSVQSAQSRRVTAEEFVLFRLAVTMTESRVVANFTKIFRSSDPG